MGEWWVGGEGGGGGGERDREGAREREREGEGEHYLDHAFAKLAAFFTPNVQIHALAPLGSIRKTAGQGPSD